VFGSMFVSAVLISCSKYTSPLTFENLYQERFFKDRALEAPVFFVVLYTHTRTHTNTHTHTHMYVYIHTYIRMYTHTYTYIHKQVTGRRLGLSASSRATPEMLVSFASNVTAVRVPRISDPEDFRESCLRRKQCALVIFDGIINAE